MRRGSSSCEKGARVNPPLLLDCRIDFDAFETAPGKWVRSFYTMFSVLWRVPGASAEPSLTFRIGIFDDSAGGTSEFGSMGYRSKLGVAYRGNEKVAPFILGS